jgi:hypothetical protein
MLLTICDFMKIGAVKATLCLWASMNLYLCPMKLYDIL